MLLPIKERKEITVKYLLKTKYFTFNIISLSPSLFNLLLSVATVLSKRILNEQKFEQLSLSLVDDFNENLYITMLRNFEFALSKAAKKHFQ